MKIKFPRRKRLLKWGAILIVVLFFGFICVFPMALGIIATRTPRIGVGETPEGFETVHFRTDDNLELEGWYAPPQNGVVIIVVHGAGDSRNGIRGHVEYLHDAGFGVLAFDMRGNGKSEGHGNIFGWNGTADVGVAVNFLLEQEDVIVIGGYGRSLGGEVLLGAAESYPQIGAIISDGASARSVGEYEAHEKYRTWYGGWFSQVIEFSIKLTSDDEPPDPLLDSIIAAENTQILFIVGGKNEEEVEFNHIFMDNVGERGTMWLISDVGHTGGYSRYPDEYEQRVIEFFTATLLTDGDAG